MVTEKLGVSPNQIEAFCRKWQVRELAIFGSALRDDFGPDSDVDVLVQFSDDAHRSLFDMVDMEDELERLFGREVDLVSRRGVEQSRNYLRRKAILNAAEVVYAQR
jgi:hypothetical protein